MTFRVCSSRFISQGALLFLVGFQACTTTLDEPSRRSQTRPQANRGQKVSAAPGTLSGIPAEPVRVGAAPELVQSDKAASAASTSDESDMILGHQAYAKSDFERAIKHFSPVVNLNPPSRFRGEALFMIAQSEGALGRNPESLATLSKINLVEVPAALRGRFFAYWAKSATEAGRALEATLALIKANREVTDPEERKNIEAAVEANVQDRLSDADLNFVLREYPLPQFPAGPVLLRLVTVKLATGQRLEAQGLLQSIVATLPSSSKYHQKARVLLTRLSSLSDAATQRVGALLPLSGEQEGAGRAIVEGLQMALNRAEGEDKLVLADSGPTVETAEAAFDRLVFEEKVMAVVGPLNGVQVDRISTKAAELGVPYISLSPRAGMIEKGPSIFRLALTPERQVKALVAYSWDRFNARRFAILFPEDNFGKEYATEYFRAVQEQGGVVTAAESYDPKQSDFRIQIENMVGKGFPAFRRTESEDAIKREEEKLQRKLTRKETEKLSNPPIVDFDVIFIPDTYKALGQIAPALLFADVTTPLLLGPSSWHNPKLLERAGQYLEKALFVDMFAANRQSEVTKKFVQQYQARKGISPGSLAAIGYDVGLSLKAVFDRGSLSGRDELRARLEGLGTVDGALGLHNWDSKRDALAEIQLYQIKKDSFHHEGGILLKNRRR